MTGENESGGLSPLIRHFGRHVCGLRRVRGLTQRALAKRSGLSEDTVRRLEHGSFSPSLTTLSKLAAGFEVALSTMFEAFELGQLDEARELIDLVSGRHPRHIALATNVVRLLFDELDAGPCEPAESEDED